MSRSSSTRHPYEAIIEQLPVQLAADERPDIARITDLGGLSKYYLDIRRPFALGKLRRLLGVPATPRE